MKKTPDGLLAGKPAERFGPSPRFVQAARRMLGAVDKDRVMRLAVKLEVLKSLDDVEEVGRNG